MNDQIVSKKDIHYHLPNEAETKVKKIVDSLKEKVRTTAQPIPVVYNEEIQAFTCRSDRDKIVAKLLTFSSLKISLYRASVDHFFHHCQKNKTKCSLW